MFCGRANIGKTEQSRLRLSHSNFGRKSAPQTRRKQRNWIVGLLNYRPAGVKTAAAGELRSSQRTLPAVALWIWPTTKWISFEFCLFDAPNAGISDRNGQLVCLITTTPGAFRWTTSVRRWNSFQFHWITRKFRIKLTKSRWRFASCLRSDV